MVDLLGILGTIFWLVPVTTFYFIFVENYKYVTNESLTMYVLALRAVSLLPTFMTFIFIALWAPSIYAVLKVLAAVFEAYGVYCILTLMVKCVGGSTACIDVVSKSEKGTPCCETNRKQYPAIYYSRTCWAIKQFLYLRPTIMAAGVPFWLKGIDNGYTIATALGGISTLYMIPWLFTFAWVMYDECERIGLFAKLVTVKISVGIILIEDIVMQMLFATDTISISDDMGLDQYTEEEKFVRLYAVIALSQGALLSIAMWYGFSHKMDLPSTALDSTSPLKQHINDLEVSLTTDLDSKPGTFWEFAAIVCRVRGIKCSDILHGEKIGQNKRQGDY